jgi:hypothetical protein
MSEVVYGSLACDYRDKHAPPQVSAEFSAAHELFREDGSSYTPRVQMRDTVYVRIDSVGGMHLTLQFTPAQFEAFSSAFDVQRTKVLMDLAESRGEMETVK